MDGRPGIPAAGVQAHSSGPQRLRRSCHAKHCRRSVEPIGPRGQPRMPLATHRPMTVLAAIRFVDAPMVVEAAAAIARRLQQPLHLVHVVPAEAAQLPGNVAQTFFRACLEAQARRVRSDVMPVSVEVASGETHLELLAVVARCRASLLVAGRPPPEPGRGRGGTVDRLSAHCPVPMIAISTAERFAAWEAGSPLRVTAGVDTSPPTFAALRLVEMLARAGPVELTAVRIVYPIADCPRLGLPLPRNYFEVSPELEAALRREVDTVVRRARALCTATVVSLQASLGRPADPLVDKAVEAKADLLVVGTHQRRALGRLWSVSHHALRLAQMAVATVPATSEPVHRAARFETVVAATDFSPLGNRAVALGIAALQDGGTLHLVFVAPELPSPAEQTALLERLRALVPEGEGVGVEAEVRVRGAPAGSDEAACILQTSERVGADLICVGAGGKSALLNALLGSVASRVMAGAHVPVLVARPAE
jgi:nucleotide-binding universal stress UspA family protein